jgi:FKBP-type peptidyl-prolyl cis-trans isomerase FkpA
MMPRAGLRLLAGILLSLPGALSAQVARDSLPRDTAHAPHGDPQRTTFAPELSVDLAKMRRLPSGVYVRDIEVGTGAIAAPGREVAFGYILYLADGREIERSEAAGPQLRFTIGEGQVIRGWDTGLRGMRAGGTRLLVVPARLGYGSEGTVQVPPNAVLVFVISLDAVR